MKSNIFNITNIDACLAIRFAAGYSALKAEGHKDPMTLNVFDFANLILMVKCRRTFTTHVHTYYFIDDSSCSFDEKGEFKIHSIELSN